MVSSSLPRVGLGMAALGRPGYINLERSNVFGSDARTPGKMQSQADLVLDCLFELTEKPWIDCARSYGLSEKFVGEYLKRRQVDPEKVFVSSKWGYTYVADWKVALGKGEPHEVKDHSVENFLKQLEETKSFIGKYVDLYQIHSATFESGVLENREVHAALHKCRTELGWSIGLSVSSPKQDEVLRHAMGVAVNGERLFDSVQCTYNVLEQKPGKALLEAHRAGMDIIVKEGLANGRVLKNPNMIVYAEKLSCKPDQLALACILAQPFRPGVLSGAVTREQLSSNLKSRHVAEYLERNWKLLDEIMSSTAMSSEAYWTERSALSWN